MSTENFLREVLGLDGAGALLKAVARAPILEPVLVPRTILSWLATAIRIGYEGCLPGLDNSYLVISKNEQDNFTGAVTIGGAVYEFEDTSITHVAAALGMALGVHLSGIDPMIKSQDLTKLGKTIDLLVKAKIVTKELAKNTPASVYRGISDDEYRYITDKGHILSDQRYCAPGEGTCFAGKHDDAESYINWGHTNPISTGKPTYVIEVEHGPEIQVDKRDGYPKTTTAIPASRIKSVTRYNPDMTFESGEHSIQGFVPKSPPAPHPWRVSPEQWGVKIQKDELHGLAAAPREPTPPISQQKQPATLKPSKTLKVTKSESESQCSDCGGNNFVDGEFRGCACVKELIKSNFIATQKKGEDFVITFGSNTDEDVVSFFMKTLRG